MWVLSLSGCLPGTSTSACPKLTSSYSPFPPCGFLVSHGTTGNHPLKLNIWLIALTSVSLNLHVQSINLFCHTSAPNSSHVCLPFSVFLTQHGKRPIICGLDLYSSLQIGMPSLLSPSCQFSASRPETSVESIRWITALPGLKSFVGGSLTALTTKYPKPGALPLPTPAR